MTTDQSSYPPLERRSKSFLLLLMALGLAAVASMLLAPLETLLPDGIDVPRAALLTQPALLVLGCAALGWWAAPKVGLDAPVLGALSEKGRWTEPLRAAVVWGVVGGVLSAAVFVAYGLATGPFFAGQGTEFEMPMVTRVLYGGVAEEIMLRWAALSVLALIALKLGAKQGAARWTGNAVTALLFAGGHLPILFALVDPPGWLFAAVIGGNGALGLIFGWLFIRRGLEAAIVAHALAHLIAIPVLVALG
jgi:hypothetical protein